MNPDITSENFISHFFFKKDKNHILKEAQRETDYELCNLLFAKTITAYSVLFNPLGIIDDTTRKIQGHELKSTSAFEGIYENIAAIYRYQYGQAQLEIIWDGKSQLEKFMDDWSIVFSRWIDELCTNKTFIKGILQLTVFNSEGKNNFFIENYLKAIVNEYFDLKVLTRNGTKKIYVKIPEISKVG